MLVVGKPLVRFRSVHRREHASGQTARSCAQRMARGRVPAPIIMNAKAPYPGRRLGVGCLSLSTEDTDVIHRLDYWLLNGEALILGVIL